MIKASLVGKLRAKTGAAIMDCKKVLTETEGDFDKAVELLRKKGLSRAAKKMGNAASEGLVGVKTKSNKGIIVELNSQTDFVAKNQEFQKLLDNIAETAIELPKGSNIEEAKIGDKQISDIITDSIAKIGENIKLRRFDSIAVSKGLVSSYVHNSEGKDKGKIGVLVALESEADAQQLEQIGKEIAMHVAAARPEYLSAGDVPAQTLDKERDIFAEQFRAAGKDDKIIPKMVEGRLNKFLQEIVLLRQNFIMDNKVSIEDYMKKKAAELGNDIKISDFIRYEVGEGIEKEENDFAAEVESMASKK